MCMEGTNILASRKLKLALSSEQVDDHDMCNNAVFSLGLEECEKQVAVVYNSAQLNGRWPSVRVRTEQLVSLGLGKCKKQVGIAYNSAQLKRSFVKRRSDLCDTVVAATDEKEEERRLQRLAEQEQEQEQEEVEDDIG
uniref:Uncharacterized protein n=1 Tax=Peronospora matthiolae TaxID=2874970 RepID=A0AAV1UYY6_9STRA